MDIDIMIRKLHELLAFKDKHEPMLEEIAKAKAAHEQRVAATPVVEPLLHDAGN